MYIGVLTLLVGIAGSGYWWWWEVEVRGGWIAVPWFDGREILVINLMRGHCLVIRKDHTLFPDYDDVEMLTLISLLTSVRLLPSLRTD